MFQINIFKKILSKKNFAKNYFLKKIAGKKLQKNCEKIFPQKNLPKKFSHNINN